MSAFQSKPSSLPDLAASIGRVSEAVGPAVVGLGRGFGPGSGVLVEDNRILTAAIGGGSSAGELTIGGGPPQSGRRVAADPSLGLALVVTDEGAAPTAALPAEPGKPLGIGTPVVALADPGGRGLRATLGFVASSPRTFRGPGGRRVEGAIEHTAPLPRGSSGGPLVDLEGRLVGINVLRREGGLIVAVPAAAEQVERLARIERGEAAGAPRLGVALAPPAVARRLRRAVGLADREGLLVRAVAAGSPAEGAGLLRGDLIVGAGGRGLESIDGLLSVLEEVGGGGELALAVVRGDRDLDLVARLEEAQEDEATGAAGRR